MSSRRMGMSLRVTDRRNRDGATVACDALAENVWNAGTKRAEARVVHIFGPADQVDTAALCRLVASNNRVLDAGDAATAGGKPVAREIEIDAAFDLGVVLAACGPWEQLGIGEAIRTRMQRAGFAAPHATALFAMPAQQPDDPGSKRACAMRWLPDLPWLPEASALSVDQFYRALEVLAVCSDAIERDVFLRAADLLRPGAAWSSAEPVLGLAFRRSRRPGWTRPRTSPNSAARSKVRAGVASACGALAKWRLARNRRRAACGERQHGKPDR